MTVPVVDLGVHEERVIAALDDACRRIGFFQIVGHGVDPVLEAAAWQVTAAFFSLPEADKRAVAIPPGDAYGYGPFRVERLAASLGDDTPPDLKETFSVGPDADTCASSTVDDPSAAFVFSATPWPSSWPSDVPGMEATLRSYYDELAALVERIMALMARALGLAADHFGPSIDRHTSALRLLHYPDLAAVEVEPGQLRAGAHTDYGTLTLLRQDGAPGGLQVRDVEGVWHDVPAIDGAYVVNIGDALERWTNDRWRSTLHRVAIPPGDAAGSTERQSIAFFHNANWDALIECIPTCLAPGETPRYGPVTAGRHLMDKFLSTQS